MDADFIGLEQLPYVRKVDELLKEAMVDALTRMFVLPRTLTVYRQPDPPVDYLDVANLPAAVLRLQVLQARGLNCCNAGLFELYPDPYVNIWCGCTNQRTETINDTFTPEWKGQPHDFVLTDTSQIVRFEVYDEDVGKPDDLLGRATLPVQAIVARRGPQWIRLADTDYAEILVQGSLWQFTTEPAETYSGCFLGVITDYIEMESEREGVPLLEVECANVVQRAEPITFVRAPRAFQMVMQNVLYYIPPGPGYDVIVRLLVNNNMIGEAKVPLTRLIGQSGLCWKGDLPLLGTQARARIRLQAFGLRERRSVSVPEMR